MRVGDIAGSSMDLIAHWLKNEPSLQQELHDAVLAMGQQLHETPEAEQWPLRQWQRWLEENSFDLQLLQQALLQLFTNAGEAEPYAAIHQELNQQPGDGPGIERLLNCAEHHSEQLVPQLLEELEAEAKETEALLQTSGGSSSSHHKGLQYMSNHRTGLSAGGGTVGAVVLGGLGIWAYRTHSARDKLKKEISSIGADLCAPQNRETTEALLTAERALKSKMPGTIKAAQDSLNAKFPKLQDMPAEHFYKENHPLGDGAIALRDQSNYDNKACITEATNKIFNLRGTDAFKDDKTYLNTVIKESFQYLKENVCKDDPEATKELADRFFKHLNSMLPASGTEYKRMDLLNELGDKEHKRLFIDQLNEVLKTDSSSIDEFRLEELFNSGAIRLETLNDLPENIQNKFHMDTGFNAYTGPLFIKTNTKWTEGNKEFRLLYKGESSGVITEGDLNEVIEILYQKKMGSLDPRSYLKSYDQWKKNKGVKLYSDSSDNPFNEIKSTCIDSAFDSQDSQNSRGLSRQIASKVLQNNNLIENEELRHFFTTINPEPMSADQFVNAINDVKAITKVERQEFESTQFYKDFCQLNHIASDYRQDIGGIGQNTMTHEVKQAYYNRFLDSKANEPMPDYRTPEDNHLDPDICKKYLIRDNSIDRILLDLQNYRAEIGALIIDSTFDDSLGQPFANLHPATYLANALRKAGKQLESMSSDQKSAYKDFIKTTVLANYSNNLSTNEIAHYALGHNNRRALLSLLKDISNANDADISKPLEELEELQGYVKSYGNRRNSDFAHKKERYDQLRSEISTTFGDKGDHLSLDEASNMLMLLSTKDKSADAIRNYINQQIPPSRENTFLERGDYIKSQRAEPGEYVSRINKLLLIKRNTAAEDRALNEEEKSFINECGAIDRQTPMADAVIRYQKYTQNALDEIKQKERRFLTYELNQSKAQISGLIQDQNNIDNQLLA